MFFRTKSETAQDRAVRRAHQAGDAAAAAGDRAASSLKESGAALLHTVGESVGPRAEAARDSLGGAASRSRAKAVAGLDRGIDTAVPRVQQSVAGVGPKVDHARDVLVDDLLPRIQELLGNVQDGKDDLLSRQDGPIAVVTGAPKQRKKKGGLLITIGLLAAVGAGIAYVLSKQQGSGNGASDPWAGSGDRPIGGTPGVDTQVRETLKNDTPSAGERASDGTASDGTASGGSAATTTSPSASSSTFGAAGGTAAGTAAANPSPTDRPSPEQVSGDPHMLDNEEIEQLAANDPLAAGDDVPGTNTDQTTGFGTDAGDEAEGRHRPTGDGGDQRS